MSRSYIPAELRQFVADRANGSCEYCHLHQDDTLDIHEIDHVIAEKHGGITEESNLTLACIDCNRNKGSDISSIDPKTGETVSLFNPRSEKWEDHFAVDDHSVKGITAKGRATSELLKMNSTQKINQRQITSERFKSEDYVITNGDNSIKDKEQDYSYGYGY